MTQMKFNWLDYQTEDFFLDEDSLVTPKIPMDIDMTAYVRIDMHETEACDRKALIRARKKFINISNSKPKFQSVEVLKKSTIILFTSRKIEYIIKILADYNSVTEYYNNARGEDAKY